MSDGGKHLIEIEQRKLTASLVQKNWEIVQALIARTADIRWKLKAGGVITLTAVIGYGVSHGIVWPLVSVQVLILLVFSYDVAFKMREEQLLRLNARIERVLTATARGDHEAFFRDEGRVSTSIPKDSFKSLRPLLRRGRWQFWTPYVVVWGLMAVLTVMVLGGLISTRDSASVTPPGDVTPPLVKGLPSRAHPGGSRSQPHSPVGHSLGGALERDNGQADVVPPSMQSNRERNHAPDGGSRY